MSGPRRNRGREDWISEPEPQLDLWGQLSEDDLLVASIAFGKLAGRNPTTRIQRRALRLMDVAERVLQEKGKKR